jgi:acetyl esterase/lipase
LSDLKDRRAVHPFPTALLDAIAGYRYLVNELRYSPENIVLEGDSAGGNLALALCRYLIENPEAGLAPPGALLLISPWTDLGLSHITPGSSALPAKPADILGPTKYGPGTSHFSVQAYLGPDNVSTLAETDVFISPASLNIQRVDFGGFPKTLIVSGDADLLYDQIKTLYHRMAQDLGEQIEYYEAKDAVHDFVSMEPFEPERTAALQKIASWVDVSG